MRRRADGVQGCAAGLARGRGRRLPGRGQRGRGRPRRAAPAAGDPGQRPGHPVELQGGQVNGWSGASTTRWSGWATRSAAGPTRTPRRSPATDRAHAYETPGLIATVSRKRRPVRAYRDHPGVPWPRSAAMLRVLLIAEMIVLLNSLDRTG